MTDSVGIALLDLANLPPPEGGGNEYDIGDVILIIAYNGNNSDGARYVVAGDEKEQTLNLNAISHSTQPSTVRLMHILTAETAGSASFAKIYAVDDGELLAHIETLANSSVSVMFGSFGKAASGGFIVEREATDLIVTATVK